MFPLVSQHIHSLHHWQASYTMPTRSHCVEQACRHTEQCFARRFRRWTRRRGRKGQTNNSSWCSNCLVLGNWLCPTAGWRTSDILWTCPALLLLLPLLLACTQIVFQNFHCSIIGCLRRRRQCGRPSRSFPATTTLCCPVEGGQSVCWTSNLRRASVFGYNWGTESSGRLAK